jgi:hypothetical protein
MIAAAEPGRIPPVSAALEEVAGRVRDDRA